jgi:hypothetical protein
VALFLWVPIGSRGLDGSKFVVKNFDSYITNATGFMKLVFELIEDLDANTMYKVTMIQWSYGGEETKDVGMISCQSTFDVNRRTNEQREDCRKAKKWVKPL